jgi:hypothetical protein
MNTSNNVTVVNPSSKPIPVNVSNQPISVSPVLTPIESFTYIIEPHGDQPIVNFGILIGSDSILEAISYYSATSPLLTLTLYLKAWAPPAVLGAIQGADIIPQPDARFHFILSPTTMPPAQSVIAFTAMTNIHINNERLDITIHRPDDTNIPSTATANLTLQFRKRY